MHPASYGSRHGGSREAPVTTARKIRLKPGRAYCVYERSPEYVFRAIRDAVQRGRSGLIVSRMNPAILREDYKLKRIPVLWLTEAEGDDHISTNDPVRLYDLVRSIATSTAKAVVALEGVGYMGSRIGSARVAQVLEDLRDLVTGAGGTFVVSVDATAADESLLSLLEREFEPLAVPPRDDHRIIDVFVIDAVGGILIGHAARQSRMEIDADVMAGMLTVIMNFVKVSFAEGSDQLRRFELGDRTVIIERGERFLVAVVFTGQESHALRAAVQAFAARAERLYGPLLDRWSGDLSEMSSLEAMAGSVFFEQWGRS